MLDHSPSAKVAWHYNVDSCTITTDETLDAGREVFNNYGPKSNEELLMGYGFTLEDNQADTFGLGFNAAMTRTIRTILTSRNTDLTKNGECISG